jgi:hypothetical protein
MPNIPDVSTGAARSSGGSFLFNLEKMLEAFLP